MQREVPSYHSFWYSRGTAWAEAWDSTATVLHPQQRWHQREEWCWGKQTWPFVPIHVLSSLCSRLRQGERGWISREGDWPFPGEKANTSAQTCGKQISQKGWEKQHWLLQGLVLRGSALCSHVVQAVQPTGSCRAHVRARGEAPLFSQGTTNCSAPGRKRHQIQ